MFESVGVMTRKELEARNEVKWETYTKKIQIEARVLGDLAINHIIPIAIEYQSKLIDNVYKLSAVVGEEKAKALSAENLRVIEEIAERTAFISEHVKLMVEARKRANRIASEREKAIAYHDSVESLFDEIRYHIDKLELDDKGEVKDAKKHADSLKADWSDFVGTTTTTGARVDTPPTNTGSKMTKEQIINIKDATERQAAIAANPEAFGLAAKE